MKRSIAELLRETSQRFPDRPYLIEGSRILSYGQVWDLTERLAAYFAKQAEPGGRLLIASGNSFDYIVTYFAALCARQTTVEVSPSEPREVLRQIAAETSAWAVFTDIPDLADELHLQRVDVKAWVERAGRPLGVEQQIAATESSELASIVYTSGTTGRSKGVMLTHGNFRAVTDAIVDYLEISPDDRYLLVLPLFHTYAKSILLTTTQRGGSICLFDEFANLPRFLQTLAEQRITMFGGVPFHYNMLLRRANLGRYDLKHLEKVTVSGAPIDPDRIAEFRRALPHVEFFSMFGLTESCTRATYLPPRDLERKRGSVGIPINGVTVSIRDDRGGELPADVEGDIWLAGPNIMLGYFNAPELTAESLRDGWLITGDVGYLDEEGYLFITDRKKDIIKCAGERISAREIENVIEAHPGVVEVAVIGLHDPILGESVCAVLVSKGPTVKETDLRTWCNERLSYHRVPRTYRFVEELPKTPSGKIKKQMLRSLHQPGAGKERVR